MKSYSMFLILFLCSFSSVAQNFRLPKDEFEFVISNKPIKIQRGDSTTVEVTILKAKGFAKAKTTLKLNSELPKGVIIKIFPETGVFDKTTISIIVSEEVQTGQLSLNITAEMRHIKKGLITSFEILP